MGSFAVFRRRKTRNYALYMASVRFRLVTRRVAGLLCAPATAFASAGAGLGQPASGPAITQQAQVTPDANADDSDNSDDDTAAPIPAPIPDPFIAEALKACRDGASGDKGTLQRLAVDGWAPSVDGDTQTPFYQSFSGEKDFDGVGTADITFSQEVYPTMTEGYCSLSIDSAERKIGIADLAKVPGLKGQLKNTNDGVASTWEDTSADPPTYIQADQHAKDLYFLLDVTKLMKRPLAELPFVQPEDSTDPGATDDGSDASACSSTDAVDANGIGNHA